ncbi:oxidoreductase NAD-binding domain-containing protein 1 isoform X1 [Octopus sinensis]|uniref:Oxidoreductase NAD-binding domain-containing protein 1 n=2 Tax=Octopus sinensis TaxID=2607531 RepID=A0A6P7SQS7_9MOLL|nr:oxidoreductase NAD-binding domain-containing protein 1 isoform X1 [Octopus sinensis]XP_029640271.1 oxidoreductase NAD-binding domain-containing protein 1 isoform X1 [Octopus sinensis]
MILRCNFTRSLPLLHSHVSSCLLKRMSVENNSSHLDLTAKDKDKTPVISPASVDKVWSLSPTVKSLKLYVNHYKNMSFKAGQWLDLMIPNISRIGGYSMVSSPVSFEKDGILQLAVKFSDHAPTYWVHKQCAVGNTVSISFGGEVFYDPKPEDSSQDLLLIGGGIGVNPLCSIMNRVADFNLAKQSTENSSGYQPGNTLLLYSSSTASELLFKDDLDLLQKKHDNIHCRYFVTQEESKTDDIAAHRMTTADIEEAFKLIDKKNCQVYICGPVGFIDDMEKILINLEVDSDHIQIERWW